jgi:hypothetical protein
MTPGRAVLVGLMERYLRGLMEPWVTLLEVHKLMYFAQVAGEPLRLNFAQGPYGPYAENLRHVLAAIEGHLVAGYADGGDRPDKQLALVPRAVEDARDVLAGHPDSLARFLRVTELVEGFETPMGWSCSPRCIGSPRGARGIRSKPQARFTPGMSARSSSPASRWHSPTTGWPSRGGSKAAHEPEQAPELPQGRRLVAGNVGGRRGDGRRRGDHSYQTQWTA